MSLQDKLKRTLELTRQKIEAQNDSEKSNFFPTIPTIPNQFVSIIVQMNAKLNELNFGPPVACVYNPTEYAFDPYFKYLNQYCATTKEIMFLGMNPGPFGMCQTGVSKLNKTCVIISNLFPYFIYKAFFLLRFHSEKLR